MPRPEVASGAQPWPANQPADAPDPGQSDDATSSCGGPEFNSADADEGAVAEFLQEPDVAGYLDADLEDDADLEVDATADEPQDHAPSGYARRRITRGYSIPRLSRSKRPGAIPGAQQPG